MGERLSAGSSPKGWQGEAGRPVVRIEGLRKSFGSHEVLRDIDFEIMPGEVVT